MKQEKTKHLKLTSKPINKYFSSTYEEPSFAPTEQITNTELQLPSGDTLTKKSATKFKRLISLDDSAIPSNFHHQSPNENQIEIGNESSGEDTKMSKTFSRKLLLNGLNERIKIATPIEISASAPQDTDVCSIKKELPIEPNKSDIPTEINTAIEINNKEVDIKAATEENNEADQEDNNSEINSNKSDAGSNIARCEVIDDNKLKLKRLINEKVKGWYKEKVKQNHPLIKNIQQNKLLCHLLESEAAEGSDNESDDDDKFIDRDANDENEIGLDKDDPLLINDNEHIQENVFDHSRQLLLDALSRDESDLSKVLMKDFRNGKRKAYEIEDKEYTNFNAKRMIIESMKKKENKPLPYLPQPKAEQVQKESNKKDELSDDAKEEMISISSFFEVKKTVSQLQVKSPNLNPQVFSQKVDSDNNTKNLTQLEIHKKLIKSSSLISSNVVGRNSEIKEKDMKEFLKARKFDYVM